MTFQRRHLIYATAVGLALMVLYLTGLLLPLVQFTTFIFIVAGVCASAYLSYRIYVPDGFVNFEALKQEAPKWIAVAFAILVFLVLLSMGWLLPLVRFSVIASLVLSLLAIAYLNFYWFTFKDLEDVRYLRPRLVAASTITVFSLLALFLIPKQQIQRVAEVITVSAEEPTKPGEVSSKSESPQMLNGKVAGELGDSASPKSTGQTELVVLPVEESSWKPKQPVEKDVNKRFTFESHVSVEDACEVLRVAMQTYGVNVSQISLVDKDTLKIGLAAKSEQTLSILGDVVSAISFASGFLSDKDEKTTDFEFEFIETEVVNAKDEILLNVRSPMFAAKSLEKGESKDWIGSSVFTTFKTPRAALQIAIDFAAVEKLSELSPFDKDSESNNFNKAITDSLQVADKGNVKARGNLREEQRSGMVTPAQKRESFETWRATIVVIILKNTELYSNVKSVQGLVNKYRDLELEVKNTTPPVGRSHLQTELLAMIRELKNLAVEATVATNSKTLEKNLRSFARLDAELREFGRKLGE